MKKRLLVLLIIILAAVIYTGSLLTQEFWSVTGQSAFELAKVEWAKDHWQKAVEFWFYGIGRTIRDTINREEAYRILRQSDELLNQRKLTDALNSCNAAAKIYDEEGEISYRCMLIEQKIFGTPAPVSTP
jgi:hypothetical protein